MVNRNIRTLFFRLISEGRIWSLFRFLFVCFILFGIVTWSAKLFVRPEKFPWILFKIAGLRFWIFPILGFIVALITAGHYVRELHHLPKLSHGVSYVLSVLFGFSLPSWKIENGDWENLPDRFNRLRQVGGPGWLNILPGNLVLVENLQGPSNVLGLGFHFISRRENVRETVNLSDQHGYIPERRAMTKDGIEVVIRDIRYHYRLRPSRRRGEYIPRSPLDPYPYTTQSLRNLVYNRTVSAQGMTPIPMAMDFIVDSAITDFINEHQFDFITFPQWGNDPRGQIRSRYNQDRIQERLRGLGMELLWVDIGHFDVSDDIWEQRVMTWGARWSGKSKVELDLGETKLKTYRRIAQAEGRADALQMIVDALKKANLPGTPTENVRRLVILYIARILDEMGDIGND